MKKIGRQVLFIGTGENNPRNGEGAFIRLNDGGIMYAYTEYIGSSWHDHANARITAVFSYDEGENWSEKRVLYTKNPDDMNLMSISLLRMKNGDIGLFFGIYPEYFMGDFTADRGAPEPFVYVSYPENENGEMLYFGDPKEVEELYGAKIISYEYDEPVENRFVMFKYK